MSPRAAPTKSTQRETRARSCAYYSAPQERRGLVGKLHGLELEVAAIADVLEVSPRTVGRDLAAAGLKPRRRGRPRAEPEPERPLEKLAGEPSTEEERTEQLRRLYELQRRQLEERLCSGKKVHPNEILTLQQVEWRLGQQEQVLRLNALTRERGRTQYTQP